ncbi:MAG: phage holin family protein [bacterium]
MGDSLLRKVLAAVAAAGLAIWGWLGWLAIIWVASMALDYLTGTVAALRKGEWSSAAAWEGLWHKAGSILAVLVAVLADLTLAALVSGATPGLTGSALVTPLVLAWYSLTELGSVLENAVSLGAPVPTPLRRLLRDAKEALEKERK